MKPKKINQRIRTKNEFEDLLKKFGIPPCKNRIFDIWIRIYYLLAFEIYPKELAFTLLKKNDYSNPLISHLAANATVIYLLAWLENDSNSKQTLEKFLLSPYSSVDKEIKRLRGDMDYTQLEKLKRSAQKYTDLIVLQNEELKSANQPFKRLAYKKANETVAFSFIDLRHIDLYSKNKYPRAFNDYLFHKQPPPISKACAQYDNLLNELDEINNSKEFVISYLHLIKYELQYRFVLYGKIAKYKKDHHISKYDPLPPVIRTLIFSGKYKKSRHFVSYKEIGNSILLWNYDQLMEALFNSELSRQRYDLILNNRKSLQIALTQYLKFYPIKKLSSWNEDDFKNTSIFLSDNFNVFNIFTPLSFDTNPESEYDYYDYLDTIFNLKSYINVAKRKTAQKNLQDKIHRRVPKKKK